MTAGRAEARTDRFVELLAAEGCAPTLATPGGVVVRHAAFIRHLQSLGVEIAVHSHDHLDLRSLPPATRRQQLHRAVAAFRKEGITVTGFRAPYLGYEPSMREAVPRTVHYSSNAAVRWPVVDGAKALHPEVFDALARFYRARPAEASPVVPYFQDGLLEIPVSLPDDLQCLDGLGTGVAGLTDAWRQILHASHARGELFVALAHPETADECADAFVGLLRDARSLQPAVWVTRLVDLADWWNERRSFAVDVAGCLVRVRCSDRATVLLRGPGPEGVPWSDGYRVVSMRIFDAPDGVLPFIGVVRPTRELVNGLAAEGFVVEIGEAASRCATVLDEATVASLGDVAAVVAHLDHIQAPLLRFGRWPDAARSALSVTGDLDALSLWDYATRVGLSLRNHGTYEREITASSM
jgi:peptidoglycan/xylan/chitin deacetylase (PgdA/CDA1 family)